jgi:hypothetical protein
MNPVQPNVSEGSCAAAMCLDPDSDRYVTSKHCSIYPTKDDVSAVFCKLTVIHFSLFCLGKSSEILKWTKNELKVIVFF